MGEPGFSAPPLGNVRVPMQSQCHEGLTWAPGHLGSQAVVAEGHSPGAKVHRRAISPGQDAQRWLPRRSRVLQTQVTMKGRRAGVPGSRCEVGRAVDRCHRPRFLVHACHQCTGALRTRPCTFLGLSFLHGARHTGGRRPGEAGYLGPHRPGRELPRFYAGTGQEGY